MLNVKIDTTEIGRSLALDSDEQQANLINVLSSELKIFCKGNYDMQLSYLSDRLNNSGIRFIKDLYEFILLREGENKFNNIESEE